MTVEAIRILIADDDVEDQVFMKRAFKKAHSINNLAFVNDGEELMQYLRQQGKYGDAPLPDILLLDLNMPKKDGREALQEIKGDPDLRHIPVVVLTTSEAEEDILRTYRLGANSYIQKPVTFEKMVEVADGLGRYWLGIVKLPPNGAERTYTTLPASPGTGQG